MDFFNSDYFDLDLKIYQESIFDEVFLNFKSFCDVKLKKSERGFIRLFVNVKPDHSIKSEQIKSELLNFLLGKSMNRA